MNRTLKALMERGLDSDTSSTLVRDGFTVNSLKQLSQEELVSLGVPEHVATDLLSESRPPIPPATLEKLLYESRWTCCVCTKPDRPVIVHHIVEWAESRSHDETNLVVLCVEHHDAAHTKHALSQNLTPKLIATMKEKWIAEARVLGLRSSIQMSWFRSGVWDYFNHKRLNELFLKRGLDVETQQHYDWLRSHNIITDRGVLIWPLQSADLRDARCLYLLDAEVADRLQGFQESKLAALLDTVPLRRIEGSSPGMASLAGGNFVAWIGKYRFKRASTATAGVEQPRNVQLVSSDINLHFTINAWEALSSSALDCHLSGTNTCTAVFLVRSIDLEDSRVATTCLAIGCGAPPPLPALAQHLPRSLMPEIPD